MDSYLSHIGIKRRSGRYPWGSGGQLISVVEKLSSEGLSEKEIAQGLNISISELRNQKSLAIAELKEAQRLNVTRQRDNGMSVAAISREFNIPESTVRDLLKPGANAKFRIVKKISELLKNLVDQFGFVDVGEGSEALMSVSRTKLDNAITLLKNEGYEIHTLYQNQLAGDNKKTTIMVLGAPGSTYQDMLANRNNIAIPNFFANDSGEDFIMPSSIQNLSKDRILVRYIDDGGGDKDGLIELRKGIPEFSLGDKSYAQVRIGVEGTHYMKGMAVLRDDIPEGFDVVYYTAKDRSPDPLDAMKPQEEFGASRFGSVVKPNTYILDGQEVPGPINIVGDKKPAVEGSWAEWDRNLASQVLSKQSPRLAKDQLDIALKNYEAELSDILELTNPTVQSHLLIEFGDKLDKAAVDLKAAALPRQTTNVILPDPGLKPTDIYAPNYNDGDVVSLVRYPHGGVFEIPTLTVNNKYSEYRDIIGTDAKDAVAIHPDVAKKLSGADFDGDFVLVIPNKNKQLRTEPSLEALKNFDPIRAYPKYDGMKVMSDDQKQRLMGDVSNLITDMTIKGATESEIARAVKHSMVVIDAAKHELNYKQSYIDNGISSLKEKYQGGSRKGAATLISRAKSQERVPQRLDRYDIDPITGEKIYSYTRKTYIKKKTGEEVQATTKSTKLAEAKDAYKLSSGTAIEAVYADHSNKLKGLANQARLATLSKKPTPYSRQAARTYAKEVTSLDRKYKEALKSKPVERKAQILAGTIYKSKVDANPSLSKKQKQTEKGKALVLARARLGAKKPVIDITPKEWEAIEMGAVTKTRLKGILQNADMDLVRTYATPRPIRAGLSPAKASRAKALLGAGYTNAQVASALGISTSQLNTLDKD